MDTKHTFIIIDGADYEVIEHGGETFYLGEEIVLGPDKKEIGYVCTRGNVTVVGASRDGRSLLTRRITDMHVEADEGYVIDQIRDLHLDAAELAAERHAELEAAVDQAQAELDRHRRHMERLYRYHDECPDGDPRKARVERDMDRVMSQVHAAETAASTAVDALIAFEDAS